MPNVSELRGQLEKLIEGQLSLDEFEDWFVPYSWNIHKCGDYEVQELAYSIEHQLSEFDEDSEALRLGLESALRAFGSAENRSGDSSSLPIPRSNAAEAAFNRAEAA
jgi:hypothetical protein